MNHSPAWTKYWVEICVTSFLVVVSGALLHRAFFWQPTVPPPEPMKSCIGTPLMVDYPYESGRLEPHACKVQCENPTEQRYIVYSNGQATQCEKIPGCLDSGEDSGITCSIPDTAAMTPAQ